MYPNSPKFGSWYLVTACTHCEQRIILFRDLTEGKSELSGTQSTQICPKCDREFTSRLEHYQHIERRDNRRFFSTDF
jgi:hypothetical protein